MIGCLPCEFPADLLEVVGRVRFLGFDFDGVFTDNLVYTLQDGSEVVCCNRSDGLLLKEMRRAGIGMAILSTETNPVVSARAHKLGLPCYQGCEDKLERLQALVQESHCSLAETGFVGNDLNDEPCLRRVGLPIVVQDAHPRLIPLARYRTLAMGGRGAVREVCELFLAAYGRHHGGR